MTTPPKISVVTPSLDQGAFIQRCIDSVLAQEYESFEHIVVDGGSEDSTLEVLARHPHVQWISEPDRGQAHALNKGFARARGDLVGWLNCDDEYLPGAFAAVARARERVPSQALFAGRVEFRYEGRRLRTRSNRPRTFLRFLQPWIPFTNLAQQGVFFSRRVIERAGGVDEGLHFVMDYDLLCRTIRSEVPIIWLPERVARHNIHRGSKTGGGWRQTYPEWDRVVLKHAQALTGTSRWLFRLSYALVRPTARRAMDSLLGAIY